MPDATPGNTSDTRVGIASGQIDAESPEIALPDLDISLIRVEPGHFHQGCADGCGAERPTRSVRITTQFWIFRNLVTQELFESVMHRNPSYHCGERLPVDSVSWHEASAFCANLTVYARAHGLLGDDALFRLPREAEWEYACRTPAGAGDSAGATPEPAPVYGFGNDPAELDEYAWYVSNSGGQTHPVGEKRPNARELYDMHGNVGEWCSDWFGAYLSEDQCDPAGPAIGVRRVRRGGCWASTAPHCRGTDRVGVLPGCRCAMIGFRPVLVRP